MGMHNEGKPTHVKSYLHPHFQESFQGRQEDQYHHYQRRRWNTHQYLWNREFQNHYSTGHYQSLMTTTN
jgi:hypothetical protein